MSKKQQQQTFMQISIKRMHTDENKFISMIHVYINDRTFFV